MRILAASVLAVAASFAVASTAHAGPITCPNTGSPTRTFTLTTAVTALCGPTGDGNINAASGDPLLEAPFNWTAIDKDESPDTVFANDSWFSVTGLGGTSGTFTISPLAWAPVGPYGQLLIGFKVGNGGFSPDWATFRLAPGTLSGDWSVSGLQSLSHANLYGKTGGPGVDDFCVGPCATAVPEPATLMLLGTGLALAAVRLRRRKS